MLTILLALLSGLLSGAVGGGLVSSRILRRRRPSSADQASLDPDVEHEIDETASRWATAHGQPAAAPLVAGKLRLAYVLSQRRQGHRANRRWWR
jgi:hypothetical protein